MGRRGAGTRPILARRCRVLEALHFDGTRYRTKVLAESASRAILVQRQRHLFGRICLAAFGARKERSLLRWQAIKETALDLK